MPLYAIKQAEEKIMPDEFLATPEAAAAVWTTEEILLWWPRIRKDLQRYHSMLEDVSPITAAQLSVGLQLADAQYEGLKNANSTRPIYAPAKSLAPIEVMRTDCPLAILRSHPHFPNTLSPEIEGVWVSTNPAWPAKSIDCCLQKLQPPCHADWASVTPKRMVREHKDGLDGVVIYVLPGLLVVKEEK